MLAGSDTCAYLQKLD